jgi:isoquinoline 1-oxidoreductase beta subunit
MHGPARAHVRIGWLRSVANIYHGFAVQSFTDELAHRADRDPVDYLLDPIGPARTLDLSRTAYPNYGASIETYPWETGRLRRVHRDGRGKGRVGEAQAG